MARRGRRLVTVTGLIISGVFLYLAFRDLQPEQFFASLQNVNPLLVLLAVPVYFAAVAVIALRWQYLLRSIKHVPVVALTELVTICYMGNGIYPLRAGEALRIYLLRRNHQVPLASATITAMIERALDGLVMLAFILFSLSIIDFQAPEIDAIVTVASPLFIFVMLAFFFMAANPLLLRRIVGVLRAYLPQVWRERVAKISEDVIMSLAALRRPNHLIGAVLSTFATWAIEAGVYWIVMFAFGLNLSFAAALLVIGAVNLAGAVSAAPGQVGVYEFVVSTILIAMGVPPAVAAGYAIVVHLVIWIPTTTVGFALLVRQGMGWAEIANARELEQRLAN